MQAPRRGTREVPCGGFPYALATCVVALVALAVWLSSPAEGQTGSDLDPARCSDGSFGFDLRTNPGLASDCRALVAIKNYWLAHPANADLPADHFLRTWGIGLSWNGVFIGLTDEGARVTTLALQFQDIGGDIPVEITRLTALRELFLNHNRLTGPIPPELGNLTGLYQMHLNSNSLSGPIPAELGNLADMERMALFDNRLTGPIPPELGRLAKLTYLDFDRNRLSGPIPAELGNLTGLVTLWMRGNMLSGSLPPELGSLSSLERLYLRDNRFSGPVPEELLDLAPSRGGKLAVFDICRSGVEGPLPQVMQRIAQGSYRGPFCDDDGHIHESSIESLAAWDAAAAGCDVLNGYCPDRPATRAQAAVFLHEGVRRLYGPPSGAAALGDVPAGAWYERPAQWAVAAGVMSAPEGRFDPEGPVTRAELAQMLTAAFSHLSEVEAADGAFADMSRQPDGAVRAAEFLYAAGVTRGCSVDPLLFCPTAPATRGQMAAFLVRSMNSVAV